LNFNNFNTLEKISINFNTDLDFLKYIANKEYIEKEPQAPQHKYISIRYIPKKNKKLKKQYREVLDIKSPYSIFYKELLKEIEKLTEENKSTFLTENAHGFVKGKGILSNAEQHINKKYIFKIDISNFFNSIKIDSIKNIFIKLGCDDRTAKIFSELCTYNNELKEGLNTSPILANLYCFNIDNELINIAGKYSVTYTRYSDDITFSSNSNYFPTIDELEEIFKKYKFKLKKEKTLFLEYGQSQYVTGLSISNPTHPRIPRRTKRKIRQDLYQLDKYFWDNESKDIETKLRNVYGKIVYVMGIEKDIGRNFKNKFLKILCKYEYDLTDVFKEAPAKLNDQVFHYTDETDIKINNNHYIGLSVVTIFGEDLKNNNTIVLNDLKEEIVTDIRNGLNQKQRENIFHYCDDNTYVKEKYQSTLRTIPFEAFIIFAKGNSKNMKKKEYQRVYYKIFDSIMYKVLSRFKQNNNYIYPEENSKISAEKLRNNLSNMRGISKFTLEIATKNEVLLSMPDYILGIFRDCIKSDLMPNIQKLKSGQTLNEDNKLNGILDKIRLVVDLDNQKYYARQNSNHLNCISMNKDIASNIKSPTIIDKIKSAWHTVIEKFK
jgi:hypothetical protein